MTIDKQQGNHRFHVPKTTTWSYSSSLHNNQLLPTFTNHQIQQVGALMTQYLNINTEIIWQGVTDTPPPYYYLLPKHPGGSRHPCGATSKAHLGTQFVSGQASKKSAKCQDEISFFINWKISPQHSHSCQTLRSRKACSRLRNEIAKKGSKCMIIKSSILQPNLTSDFCKQNFHTANLLQKWMMNACWASLVYC